MFQVFALSSHLVLPLAEQTFMAKIPTQAWNIGLYQAYTSWLGVHTSCHVFMHVFVLHQLQKTEPTVGLSDNCRTTVGLSDLLSDCRTWSDSGGSWCLSDSV